MKKYITLCLIIHSTSLFSQDYHYWSEQYGAESNLMGGAVIAGVQDNSAVFYNPGAVGFIENGMLGDINNVMTGVDHGIALILGYTFFFSQLIPE